MNLNRLFPNSQKNKEEEQFNNLLYIVMVEWGWSYEEFIKTPIPLLNRLLKTHERVKKEEARANRKK